MRGDHISGGRHLKARSLVRSRLFLLSGGPEVVWWRLLLRKQDSLGLSLTAFCKKCREQFVTHLSCFPQSRCNSLAFRTPVFLRLLLGLDTYGGVDPLCAFPLFLKMVADIIATKLSIIFRGLIRRRRRRIQTVITGGIIHRLFVIVLWGLHEYNKTSQYFTSSRNMSCMYFIFYIYLKRM